MPFNAVFSWLMGKRLPRIDECRDNPIAYQLHIFDFLISQGKLTYFGQINQFESINSFADYRDKMRQAFVILSSDERSEIISSNAIKLAENLGLTAILEQDLLNEVVGLTEYPNILLGRIEQQFVSLPKEVLISSMKTHQRYFYLENKQGEIAPYFIFAANVKHANDKVIIEGNEKVLRARLADAKFFWEQDLKQPISENFAKLAKMTFHSK